MTKRLFHRTSAAAAALISNNGFRRGRTIHIGDGISLRGVWLSNRPLDVNEGTSGNEVLLEVVVDLPKAEFDFYELIEEGKPYREWCFPAKLLRNAKIRQVEL